MKKFQRKIEDFVCKNCDYEVKGNGYTNHCPKCLWSRHVDVNPGDRKEECKGMMEPIGGMLKSGINVIIQRCVKCGFERKNKVCNEDDLDVFIEI